MSNPTNLAAISSFEQLLPYLEANLDWPTKQYSFEDLTFEFEPEELGLKDADAAKIKSIHQLRPLKASQPFGIFFVEFENKKLPVVVLRRILSHLALKKRASANKTATPAWHAQDIIFVSAFGEDNTIQRELAFAHFHQTDGDLPTLRVLGWDGADTPLKLAQVDKDLRTCLRWPDDESDTAQWRAKWSAAFKHRQGYVIRTANELAQTLALFARQIRDAAVTMLEAESERGAFRKLYKGFKTALIHDLTEEAFADTYAQTITYGLLTAAISRTDKAGEEGTALVADNIADMVPVTNPFLKDMLEAFLHTGGRKGGINFDELGIQDVVDLLRDREKTDLAAVLRDFNNKTQGEDPVIHFYEHFLSAYNKKLKIQRGVFYTPQPVVSYIVRSVHELLQTEFGLEDGLASTVTWGEMIKRNPDLKLPDLSDDPVNAPKPLPESEYFVQILDPATGTATFLVEAIDVIYNHLKAKWAKSGLAAMPTLPTNTLAAGALAKEAADCKLFTDFWNLYVPKCLLPRLHGYELLMAPYAIAHMKIGLKLSETGYRFGTEERVRIYLTNALEPKVKQLPQIGFEALAHEAAAVNEIKWYKRFTVVIGNPPYSHLSSNLTPLAMALVEPYKYIGSQKIQERGALSFQKNLQDDYVKFVRLAQVDIAAANCGIIGLITNHSYLTNPTFRGLRYNLLQNCSGIKVLDLHGNSLYGEARDDYADDENVFDIQQGVSIVLLTSDPIGSRTQTVFRGDLWGPRSKKYSTLADGIKSKDFFTLVRPAPEFYVFRYEDSDVRSEYQSFVKLPDIFPSNSSGIKTHRDHFAIAIDRQQLECRIADMRDLNIDDKTFAEKYDLKDTNVWHLKDKRRLLINRSQYEQYFSRMLTRPFDLRWVYYHGDVVELTREEIMGNMINCSTNIALCFPRSIREPWSFHAFVSRNIVHKDALSTLDSCYAAPLFVNLMPEMQHGKSDIARHPNFGARVGLWLESLGVNIVQSPHIQSDLETNIIKYFYAILYSRSYSLRYAEFLKIDFPRLPLTSSLNLFHALAALGGELVSLHLMESPKLDNPSTHWIGDQKPEVEKVTYSDETVWIDKAKSAGFKGVPEAVWAFHIGGYQVCEKWLKDRKGRTLTDDDITHYHKIIVSLSETIRLMSEIDTVITTHGGWPGAFAEKSEEPPS